MLGIVAVINGLSNKDLKKELIEKVCRPFAEAILTAAGSIPGTEEMETEDKRQKLSISKVAKNLEKLSLIVRNLEPAEDNATDHVMVQVLREMWSLLETFLVQYYVRYISPRTCRRWWSLSASSSS